MFNLYPQLCIIYPQAVLQTALSSLQLYESALKSSCQWFEDAETVLKHKNQELDLTESLKDLQQVLNQEPTIKKAIQDIEYILPKMKDFVGAGVIMKLKEGYESTCLKSAELLEQLRCHQESLNR